MTYPEMVLDFLSMQRLQDREKLSNILNQGPTVNKDSEGSIKELNLEESEEIKKQFKDAISQDKIQQLDAELDRLLGE